MAEPALLELLRRQGRAISQRVLDDMYRDPFWTERFGKRGRRHADEDSDFHLQYLSRAILQDDPSLMNRYAVWLRGVLASRGMCTRHLDENFARLAAALVEAFGSDADPGLPVLDAARRSLRHETREARAAQDAGREVVADALAAHHARFPHGWKHAAARGEDALADDAANLASYVADALAFGSPATLVSHIGWFSAHLEGRGTPRAELDVLLDALGTAFERRGQPLAREYLEAARAAPTGAPATLEMPWKPSPPPGTP